MSERLEPAILELGVLHVDARKLRSGEDVAPHPAWTPDPLERVRKIDTVLHCIANIDLELGSRTCSPVAMATFRPTSYQLSRYPASSYPVLVSRHSVV